MTSCNPLKILELSYNQLETLDLCEKHLIDQVSFPVIYH